MSVVTPYSGLEPFIFISYAYSDREEVFATITYLRRAGFRVWCGVDIAPETGWDGNIASRVKKCDGFISFISRMYLESDNCWDELNCAQELGKDGLLVYLEDIMIPSDMMMNRNRMQAIYKYKYENEEDFYRKLAKAVLFRRDVGDEG